MYHHAYHTGPPPPPQHEHHPRRTRDLLVADRVVENKLFVGALSLSTTGNSLGDYFNSFGPVKDAMVMRDPHTEQSRGFGFVVFEYADTLSHVLNLTHTLDGKQIDVKRALPKASHPGELSNPQQNPKLFIGGVPGGVSDADIFNAFAPYGGVVEAYQMLDQHTRASRGFGFVAFENESYLENVLQASLGPGIFLNGYRVDLKKATPKVKAVNPLYDDHFKNHRLKDPNEVPPPPPPGTLKRDRLGNPAAAQDRDYYQPRSNPYSRPSDDGGRYRGRDRGGYGGPRRPERYSPPPHHSNAYSAPQPPAPVPAAAATPVAGMVMVPAEVAASVGYYVPGTAPAVPPAPAPVPVPAAPASSSYGSAQYPYGTQPAASTSSYYPPAPSYHQPVAPAPAAPPYSYSQPTTPSWYPQQGSATQPPSAGARNGQYAPGPPTMYTMPAAQVPPPPPGGPIRKGRKY